MLRARQLGEADRILTLFTIESGKLDAVAKGVRRTKSHFAGRLEFGTECELGMHRGRTLDVIVSAHILHSPWVKLVEPERFAVASVVAELIDAFCEPDLGLPDVYALLTGVLAAIERSERPPELLPRFSLRLLDMLGLAPPPLVCVRCSRELGTGKAWLDAEAGGLIDEGCRERWRDLDEFDARDVANFRALGMPKGSAAGALIATPRVARGVEDLLAHHLGRRPKSGAHLAGFR